jgi:hypothetical protein
MPEAGGNTQTYGIRKGKVNQAHATSEKKLANVILFLTMQRMKLIQNTCGGEMQSHVDRPG